MPRLLAVLLAIVASGSVAFAFLERAAAAAPSPAVQDKKEPETDRQRLERKARKLLDLNGVKAVQEQTVDQMFEQLKKMSLPAEYIEKFKAKFDLDYILDLNVRIYADELEEETLDAMIAFYESPHGRKYAAAFPEITRKSLEAGMEYGARVGKEVAEDMRK